MTLTDHIQPLLNKRLPAALVAGMIVVGMPTLAAEVTVPTVQPVVVEDHLNPEDSVYAGIASFQPGYDRALLASFADAFQDDVVVRAIVEPSFGKEFAAGIKKDGGAYKIFYQEVSEQLWQYSVLDMMKKGEISSSQDGKSTTTGEIAKLEKSLPANPKDVNVNRCERAVDSTLGANIVSVWRDMLLGARYPVQDSMGLDGTIFHFSGVFGYQRMAAQAWSPDEGTKAGTLAGLPYAMQKFCANASEINALTKQVDALSALLDKDKSK